MTDPLYLQPTPASRNLGLCTNSAYDYNLVAVQQSDGDYQRSYEQYCGHYLTGTAGDGMQQLPITVGQAVLFTSLLSSISAAEDCMRACDYNNQQKASAVVLYNTYCSQYTYNPTAATKCQLYYRQGINFVTSTDGSVSGGRWLTVAATDRPNGFGYKRAVEPWQIPHRAMRTAIAVPPHQAREVSDLFPPPVQTITKRAVLPRATPGVLPGAGI